MSAVTKTPDERRRNERARTAILRAARELLDRRGFQRLTIEGIAERAGVGKATIYRWWPSKAAVAMDAVLEAASARIPFPDTGSAREDLRRQIASVIELYTRTKTGRGIRALIAESQHDPSLAESLRDRFIASRRAEAATVFERGIERGELRPDLDVGVAIDALYGAVYYRLLVSHAPLDAAYADTLIDQVFPAFGRRRGEASESAGHTSSMPAPLIEFPADDPDRARRFWHGVLGVTLAPRPAAAGSGWQTDTDGLRLGVHERGPGPGDTASLPYFSVADMATTLERVRELGGSIIHPGDRWAVCRDSEGSPFALATAPAPGE
jgi:AcrR family transcriptional regulator/predicted enzyme related to lactoylglutathione lyase